METTKDNILKISKELIEAILGINNIFKRHIKDNNLIIRYRYKCAGQITNGTKIINLDTFARLCKEWGLTKGYKIQSQINYKNKGHSRISKISENEWAKGFFKDTEIEAIIKACEWILTQKDL